MDSSGEFSPPNKGELEYVSSMGGRFVEGTSDNIRLCETNELMKLFPTRQTYLDLLWSPLRRPRYYGIRQDAEGVHLLLA